VLSRQDQLFRHADPDDAGQTLGSSVPGNDAKIDLRDAHDGRIGGDADVAAQGQFGAAAQGDAVDAGDDGLPEVFDVPGDLLPLRKGVEDVQVARPLGHDGDVPSRHEGLVACAGEDDHANRVVAGDAVQGVLDLQHGLVADGVEHFRPVDGDRRHSPVLRYNDVFVLHRMILSFRV